MLIEKVSGYMDKFHMVSEGDVVVAGVSGGADSDRKSTRLNSSHM